MTTNQNGKVELTRLDKPAHEPAGNVPMWPSNRYTARLVGLPSDTISGLRLPVRQHVTYWLTFERAVKQT